MERRAAGRVAARAREDRRALVRRARDAHDRRETRGLAASGAVAGLAPTTEADLGDGTFPGASYLDAQRRVRRRQRFQHLHRSVRRVAAARMVAAPARGGANVLAAARCAGGARALAARGARRRAGAGSTDGRHCPGMPRRSRGARCRRSRARRAARRNACSMPRSSALPRAGARRHGRRAVDRARRASRAGGCRARALSRMSCGLAGMSPRRSIS